LHSERSNIGDDARAIELEPQTAIEIEHESVVNRFTRWVLHRLPDAIHYAILTVITESRPLRWKSAYSSAINRRISAKSIVGTLV
jgi:hypothetical protein